MAQQWRAAPEMTIDPTKHYDATIETDKGTIELALSAEHAPKTVNNFVFLARAGYYDGIKFHRVIADFMVQGGDPTGSGSGGPGYKFEDETRGNPLTHVAKVISMANARLTKREPMRPKPTTSTALPKISLGIEPMRPAAQRPSRTT